MPNLSQIFIGGRGRVYALDKLTGKELWGTPLKDGFFKSGNNLVSLLETAEQIYAFSYGTLYNLEKSTGDIKWQNHIRYLKHHAGLLAVDGYANSIEVGIGCDGDSSNSGDCDGGDGGD